MPAEKYNLVTYGDTNFKYSMTSVEYGPIHHHPEIEISLLLYGSCRVECMGEVLALEAGDMWIINPLKSHQLQTLSDESNAIILELQLTPEFFRMYYPNIENIEFPFMKISPETVGKESHKLLANTLCGGAEYSFSKEECYQLASAAAINQLFFTLLRKLSYKLLSAEETLALKEKTQRLRSLIDYINGHYKEPLYLTDLADQEGLSMSRLSHLFKECFGISFQDYLAQVRCMGAKRLLETTDLKLIDICMECGFSDSKYFNRDFKKFYRLSPKDYRKRYQKRLEEARAYGIFYPEKGPVFSSLMPQPRLSTEHTIFGDGTIFYEEDDALVVLQYCKEENFLGTL